MNSDPILKMAAIQMEIEWENKSLNFKKLDSIFANLPERDLILLPETFATGFTMKGKSYAEPRGGETETFLQSWARKTGALVGGGWMEQNGSGNPYNTFSLYTPDGTVFRYRKIHPFSYAGEDRHFSSGDRIISLDWKGFQITPFICYDLRFPEIFRKTVGKTDLYLVIANWPSPRIHHWMTLLKARAIENQAYVLGVNRVGVAGKIQKLYHNGYSGLFHPFGGDTILQSEREDVLLVTISGKELKKVREEFPYLKDIRGTDINFG